MAAIEMLTLRVPPPMKDWLVSTALVNDKSVNKLIVDILFKAWHSHKSALPKAQVRPKEYVETQAIPIEILPRNVVEYEIE